MSNAIWDKPGPLTDAEVERVRLHPYLTDRMLARVPALSRSREIAARHHERLDGSGYPRGLTGAVAEPARPAAGRGRRLPRDDRAPAVPAAAGSRPEAATQLRAEVAGRPAGRRRGERRARARPGSGRRCDASWPGGLTAREVEVLGLLARGHSNKEIAARLVVTPKTVSNHIEHIYTKIGVSSRAAATLFATQHGLMGSFEVGRS